MSVQSDLLSSDWLPRDFFGIGGADAGDNLRFFISDAGTGRYNGALIDIAFEHLFRDAQMLVLFARSNVDVRHGTDDPLGGADVYLQSFCDIRGDRKSVV